MKRSMRAAGVGGVVALSLGLATAGAGAALAQPTPKAAAAASRFVLAGQPRTVKLAAHSPTGAKLAAAAATPSATIPAIQTFTSSFTTAGTTYAYTMVGTNPTGAAKTTTVKNVVQPISVYIDDAGITINTPATTVSRVTNSGFYKSKAFPGGSGQYSDVYMRTQYWTAINNGAKNWHVKLGTPTVKGNKKLTIGPGLGAVQIVHKVKVGLVDINTFDQLIQPYITSTPGDTYTQIILNNVILCDFGCGIGGYHSVTLDSNGPHTYSVQSVLDPVIYGASAGFYGLSPMSHELAEWLADPYVNNVTPIWSSPLAPQYGCSNFLEVGDPLVGVNLQVGSEIYEDEAYLPWFARQTPSTSWQGRYSWFGTFTDVSPDCAF